MCTKVESKMGKMTPNFELFNNMKLLSNSIRRIIKFTSIILVVGFVMTAIFYTNDVVSTIVIVLLIMSFTTLDYRKIDIMILEKSFNAYKSLQNNDEENQDEQYIYSSLFNNITALILILLLWLAILVILCVGNNCHSIVELPRISIMLAGSIVVLITLRIYLKNYVRRNYKINFKIMKEK